MTGIEFQIQKYISSSIQVNYVVMDRSEHDFHELSGALVHMYSKKNKTYSDLGRINYVTRIIKFKYFSVKRK